MDLSPGALAGAPRRDSDRHAGASSVQSDRLVAPCLGERTGARHSEPLRLRDDPAPRLARRRRRGRPARNVALLATLAPRIDPRATSTSSACATRPTRRSRAACSACRRSASATSCSGASTLSTWPPRCCAATPGSTSRTGTAKARRARASRGLSSRDPRAIVRKREGRALASRVRVKNPRGSFSKAGVSEAQSALPKAIVHGEALLKEAQWPMGVSPVRSKNHTVKIYMGDRSASSFPRSASAGRASGCPATARRPGNPRPVSRSNSSAEEAKRMQHDQNAYWQATLRLLAQRPGHLVPGLVRRRHSVCRRAQQASISAAIRWASGSPSRVRSTSSWR